MRVTNDSPSLELLADFDALYRERHLTRAAVRAGRSQPAMSRSLARLRDTFGDALFVRGARGMSPTPRAEALAGPVAALLAEARALVTPPEFDPKTLARRFVIATSDLVDAQLLSGALAALHREAPRVDVDSTQLGYGQPGLDERADLLIVPETAVSSGAKRQHLFDDAFVSAVRRGHPLARRKGKIHVSVEAYAALDHVQIAPRGLPGGPIDDALLARGLVRRVAVRTTSFLSAPWIVARTDLVLTGPSRLLGALAPRFDLVTFRTPVDVPGFRMVQAWHARHHDDAAHRWFRALIRREAIREARGG